MRLGLNMSITGAGSVSPLAIYAVLGFTPLLVFDFDSELYATGGVVSTFDDSITHSASSNATMVDSDGALKWRPHNLALNSASPATQSITVISGADYTVECTGVSIALSGAGSGTVTEGNPVEITASTTTLTLTVTGSTGTMWVYRSDLGGMVDNPDRGDSYVPTTSAARYLPRRGHHVWNGSAWVNEGLLHESEQRVNLLTYSEDLTNADWISVSTTETANQATGPDGVASLEKIARSTASSFGIGIVQSVTNVSGANYSFSIFCKKSEYRYVSLRYYTSSDHWFLAVFDLQEGLVTNTYTGATSGTVLTSGIEDFGSGLYRISVSGSITDVDTAGNVGVFANTTGSPTLDQYGEEKHTGTIGDGFFAGFAQLEAGSTPSSYIPTSGQQRTREAETLTIPAAKLPYSATAMSIQMDGRITFADSENNNEAAAFAWAESGNNFFNCALSTLNANVGTSDIGEFRASFNSLNGGFVSYFSGVEIPVGVFSQFSTALRGLGNGTTGGALNIATDGAAAAGTTFTSSGGVLPDLDTTDLTLGPTYMGTIRTFRMWNQDLGDTGIEEASA